ncbi:MAG: hypothetical protein ACRDLB_06830 [Actinomycetota bacterium]
MKIKDLEPRMPVTIGKSESLASAAKVLADEDIGALVIFEPHGIAGILSNGISSELWRTDAIRTRRRSAST